MLKRQAKLVFFVLKRRKANDRMALKCLKVKINFGSVGMSIKSLNMVE